MISACGWREAKEQESEVIESNFPEGFLLLRNFDDKSCIWKHRYRLQSCEYPSLSIELEWLWQQSSLLHLEREKNVFERQLNYGTRWSVNFVVACKWTSLQLTSFTVQSLTFRCCLSFCFPSACLHCDGSFYQKNAHFNTLHTPAHPPRRFDIMNMIPFRHYSGLF